MYSTYLEFLKDSKVNRLYIDWNKNYNISFKLTYTPKDATDNWRPGTISFVTPLNGNTWTEWKNLSDDDLIYWKEHWDYEQTTLPFYKYKQIWYNLKT